MRCVAIADYKLVAFYMNSVLVIKNSWKLRRHTNIQSNDMYNKEQIKDPCILEYSSNFVIFLLQNKYICRVISLFSYYDIYTVKSQISESRAV